MLLLDHVVQVAHRFSSPSLDHVARRASFRTQAPEGIASSSRVRSSGLRIPMGPHGARASSRDRVVNDLGGHP